MKLVVVVFTLFSFLNAGIAQRKITRAEYIDTYKDLAMSEMKRTGIPASITLAQGILESGDGNSTLARKSNNHFGIKCHDWKGPSVEHDDDKPRECFRKYRNPEKSYLDHSDFLTGRNRYAKLFELKPDDYKGWAKGLKKAGYATSPTYAKALIGIIEANELYKYDEMVLNGSKKTPFWKRNKPENEIPELAEGLLYNNRVKYIVAEAGMTRADIEEKYHLFDWQLPKYNEWPDDYFISTGERIYLQPKRRKAEMGLKTHMVQEGETMYGISQLYAIRVDNLRERNNISKGEEPLPGSLLLLRGKFKDGASPVTTRKVEETIEEPVDSEPEQVVPEKEDEPVVEPHRPDDNDREPEDDEDEPEFQIEYDLD